MEIGEVIFPPCLNSAEVLQPCKQPFDFPTLFVPSKLSSILGLRFGSVGTMGCDHLHIVLFFEFFVQLVGVVGFVADQFFGLLCHEHLLKRGLDILYLMRRSTSRA